MCLFLNLLKYAYDGMAINKKFQKWQFKNNKKQIQQIYIYISIIMIMVVVLKITSL